MANVTIRRYGELSRGIFAILMEKPDGCQPGAGADIRDYLAPDPTV